MQELECGFKQAPLILVIAHMRCSPSPEIMAKMAEFKLGMGELLFPIAEQSQQTTVTAGQPPKATQTVLWRFSRMDRRSIVVVSPTSLVVYDASYTRFEDFRERHLSIGSIFEKFAGEKCMLKSVGMRYLSGFESGAIPSNLIQSSLHGFPSNTFETKHFHHTYQFWCDTPTGGKLVVGVKTVHGNELIPTEILQMGLAFDARFSLPREKDAIQLDIHETRNVMGSVPYSSVETTNLIGEMRRNIKRAFLAATTPEAHQTWQIHQ